MTRRRAAMTAVTVATFGLAATAGASVQQLPPGAQVNDDPAAGIDPGRDAGVSDVVGGSLTAGGVRVPWAPFEQQTAGEQQIFVRAFKGGAWKTQGRSLNIDPAKEGEAPSIDFAGPDRTVPWTAWYEPNAHLGDGTPTNIFASRFDKTAGDWVAEGQDRAPSFKVPSLNIHTDREAENPAVAGGAAVAGNAPTPWVAWQEKDGSDDTDQIFVSRGIKQTDCAANQPGGGASVSQFCWQQVGLGRLAGDTRAPGPDPTLNVDPTREGIEPDISFTGPNDTVPWAVWYEQGTSKLGLSGKQLVFAAKAVNDGNGNFHWVVVGNRASSTLDSTGTKQFGASAESIGAEQDASLNAGPTRDAENPRIATGTLTPGGITSPWVTWAEDIGNGKHGIFVSRLVGGSHFELANGGKPISRISEDAGNPDITFSGNVPYVTWHEGDKVLTGHFSSLTSFHADARTPEPAGGRSPISSSNTSDPFTTDGANPPSGAAGTPFFLTLENGTPKRLLGHAYAPEHVRTLPATAVRKHTAHIAGSVDPAGAAVKVHLEYGRTKAYGSRTADQRIPAGNRQVTFGADLAGLTKRTFTHYRTVVESDIRTFYGADAVLRTRGRHRGHVSIKQKRLWMTSKGDVIVKLRAPAGGGRATGTVKLSAKHRTLGRKHYSIRSGHTKKVKVHLNRKGQRLVRHSQGLRVKVRAGGQHRTLGMRWTR
jgi:hypothetical protein